MQEQISRLNALSLVQDCWWEDDRKLFEALEASFGKGGYTLVGTDLDNDPHRWYETSLQVFKTLYGFIGVRVGSKLYNEESTWSDIAWSYEFVEMEEIQVTSYKKK